ncbi:MAG TPA: SAM-dependent methyltransferase [Pyrinomonadaceae bacterium]
MKPISRTAFYCCGIRMQDAENDNPLCGDTYARAFMNEEALKFLETFKDDVGPNIGNVVRHRIIDDLLRRELEVNPSERILIIGAGFDTRAYRLKGGSWIEFDEPQVIAYKNERLPAGQSANELERIAVDFATEPLAEKLLPFATRKQVTVVIEGVLMYLEENQIKELLQTLGQHFPKHKLICDLMNRDFFEKHARPIHGKIASLGAPFKFIADEPAKVFRESGYELTEQIPIVQKVVEFTRPNLTEEELKSLPASLPQGYDIYVFELSDEA